ncbi:hypothetical protein [Acrocarpospora sp. B8E8]
MNAQRPGGQGLDHNGAGTGFGFQGTYSGTNTAPAQFRLNGTVCAIA